MNKPADGDRPRRRAGTPGVASPHPKPAAQKPVGRKPSRDVVLVGGPTDDGKGRTVLRATDEQLSIGEVRPIEDGKPIHGELVSLKPRPDHPAIFDVETILDAPRGNPSLQAAPRSGPPQVASDRYRENWEQIFRSRARRKKTAAN